MTAVLPDAAMIIHTLSLHVMNEKADVILNMENLSLWLAPPQTDNSTIYFQHSLQLPSDDLSAHHELNSFLKQPLNQSVTYQPLYKVLATSDFFTLGHASFLRFRDIHNAQTMQQKQT